MYGSQLIAEGTMTENFRNKADRKAAPRNGMDFEVGYAQPPISSRWDKGVCGNPARVRKRPPTTISALIDGFLQEKINISENGISRRVSKLEAILSQLVVQATAGKKGATEALLFLSVSFRKT